MIYVNKKDIIILLYVGMPISHAFLIYFMLIKKSIYDLLYMVFYAALHS